MFLREIISNYPMIFHLLLIKCQNYPTPRYLSHYKCHVSPEVNGTVAPLTLDPLQQLLIHTRPSPLMTSRYE